MQVFRHNDVVHLESVLQEGIAYGQPRTRKPWKKVLIIIEGIYSMEGEMCPLPQVVAIKKKYKVLPLTPLTVCDSFVGLNQGLIILQVKHIMAHPACARPVSVMWAQHSQMGFKTCITGISKSCCKLSYLRTIQHTTSMHIEAIEGASTTLLSSA